MGALAEDASWHAPEFLTTEDVSVLRGHLLRGNLTAQQAQGLVDELFNLRIRMWPLSVAHAQRTLDLAHNISTYDATYVVLAEALGARLVTRDVRLASAVPTTLQVELV